MKEKLDQLIWANPANLSMLFRRKLVMPSERRAFEANFPGGITTCSITDPQLVYQPVLPRFYAEPFHEDLRDDLKGRWVNSVSGFRKHNWAQHSVESWHHYDWFRSMDRWYPHFRDITPHTCAVHQIPNDSQDAWVVKGRTKSAKHAFDTMMFARNKAEAIQVMCRLQDDTTLGGFDEPIFARKYIELAEIPGQMAYRGLKMVEEYRLFYVGNLFVDGCFYWNLEGDDRDLLHIPSDIRLFSDEIGRRIEEIFPEQGVFHTFDVARTAAGGLILIEFNTFEQAGLQNCDPEVHYAALREAIELYARSID